MLEIKYKIGEKELRSAMYYPYLLRYRRSLYLLMITGIVSLFWFIGARLGAFTDLYPVYFVAVAYIFYMAVVFGRAEQTIRKYLKTPGCLLGKEYCLTLDSKNARFRVPENGSDETVSLRKLNHVADMKNILFFHVQGEQVFIVSKRAMSKEQFDTAASLLTGALGERFVRYRLFPWSK